MVGYLGIRVYHIDNLEPDKIVQTEFRAYECIALQTDPDKWRMEILR